MELATCLTSEADPELGLEIYEKRRIARTSPIVRASRWLGRIAQLEEQRLCGLRDAVLRLTPTTISMRGLAKIIGYKGHLVD
jgi:2-polyprenyl-6-methoxyphenol hydroxylase-like FAD-dependent oxidoreductase